MKYKHLTGDESIEIVGHIFLDKFQLPIELTVGAVPYTFYTYIGFWFFTSIHQPFLIRSL